MLKPGQKIAFLYQPNNYTKDAQFGCVIAIHDDYAFVAGQDGWIRKVNRNDIHKLSVV